MRRFRSLLNIVGGVVLVLSMSVIPALAASPDISQIENFGKNVIQVLVTLAGLLAAGFFVMGGINYITSSGNPESLDRSKKTILYSVIGLVIVLAAFVLSNIITQLATSAFGGVQ